MAADRDYFLGTHDEELQRLGLQHRVWRPMVLDAWYQAGLTIGSRVLDVGAGPGYATLDLAEIVGPTGQVIALERSQRYLQAAQAQCKLRGFKQVQFHEVDLMEDVIPAEGMDMAWCRWVACFVSSPQKLIQSMASTLRPGGVAIFHEYSHYATWSLYPSCPIFEEFVGQVMSNWRQSGGEPDIGRELPGYLDQAGLQLLSARPRVYCVRRTDFMWQWPAAFVEIGLQRLLDLGNVQSAWAEAVRREFAAAQSNPRTLMMTPTVLELTAVRR